jgi:hypothetical protein
MTEETLLASVRAVVSDEFGPMRQQLNSIEREQTGMAASLRHVTNNVLELKQKVQNVDDTLNGPKGLVATTGVLTWVQEHCTARLRADAEATSPGGLPAIKNAKELLDSIPPNRIQLERERTEQQREKTRRANIRLVMLLVGVALGGGGATFGVTRLVDALSPAAQASQP